jgi:hypothetical protein
MLVDLTSVRPNPVRDFTINRIHTAVVDTLAWSVEEDGFWGGLVAAPIAASRPPPMITRSMLRMKTGSPPPTYLSATDDVAMIRVYARRSYNNAPSRPTTLAVLTDIRRLLTDDLPTLRHGQNQLRQA